MAERLGRYILDRKLATGGMAEIFVARQVGPGGFEKVCAVKRMLPTVAEDQQFIRMFFDEARITARLNHPNIAQIFDFGDEHGTYYLALELVDGASLHQIIRERAKKARPLPFPIAARLVSEAALALDHAHDAVDADGRPLNVVHRDVSPHNILLSRDGVVKLIDFGVAKAANASHRTATGLVKGKFAYMSPEQLRGRSLDRRSDVYGLGLVLYELLAGTRAFNGANDAEVMQAAMKRRFDRISSRRPDVPLALEQILDRALAAEPEQRFSTAAAMSEALEGYIASTQEPVTKQLLAALLVDVGDELSGKGSSPTVRSAGLLPAVEPARTEQWDAFEDQPVDEERTQATRRQPPPLSPEPATSNDRPPRPFSRRPLLAAVATAVAIIATGGAALLLRKDAPEPLAVPEQQAKPAQAVAPVPAAAPPELPTDATLHVGSTPPTLVQIDGKPYGRAPLDLHLPPGDHLLLFRDDALGLKQQRKVHLDPREERREEWVVGKGRVLFKVLPAGEVFVGQRSLGTTPMPPVELFEGPHTFRITSAQTGKTESRSVRVEPDKDVTVTVDLR